MDNEIDWELEEGWIEATIEHIDGPQTTISMYHDEVIIDGPLSFSELSQVFLKMRELQAEALQIEALHNE